MKANKINLKIILVLVFIFLLANVSALGITPGRTSMNFEAGLHKDVSFSVLNTEKKDMNIIFAVKGDLAEYIILNQASSVILSTENSKSFSYSVDLPGSFAKPGLYEGEIMVIETPKDFDEEGAFVGATVAVISQVHVYVPYPNKYVEAELNVLENNGKLTFIVPVISRGKLDIVNIKANIDIFNGAEEKIASLETNTDTLNSLERKELFVDWNPEVNPGRYKAVVTVRYDNEVATVLKEFNIGEMFLEILEINIKDFELGEIAKFDALVENKWSSNLKDVYLNILVYNSEGEIMADFKSPTYDINSLSKSEMVAYWDTAGVHEGTYEGKLILKYGEKATDKNIQMKISQYDLEVVGFTGHVLVKGKGGSLNWNFILILIVGILVVANVIWFVLIKRLLKKKR